MKAPCYQCPDRVVGCHGRCDRYKAYDAECRKLREARLKDHEITAIMIKGAQKINKQVLRKRKGK